MSEQAIRERNVRKIWAAVGSRHDRIVRVAQVLLPALGGSFAAVMILAPLSAQNDVSFVLAKNNVAFAKERMKITNATYRGEDSEGRSFQIRAGSAIQATSRDPLVMLSQLSAQIGLTEGLATMAANTGQYDMNAENVRINGPMVFRTADNYQMTARDVSLDLKTRQITSAGAVDGHIPLGSFKADHLSADIATRTVTLQGNAHLHIDQRSGRGWKP
jgi:lipopolysaccharide export system protein LptC